MSRRPVESNRECLIRSINNQGSVPCEHTVPDRGIQGSLRVKSLDAIAWTWIVSVNPQSNISSQGRCPTTLDGLSFKCNCVEWARTSKHLNIPRTEAVTTAETSAFSQNLRSVSSELRASITVKGRPRDNATIQLTSHF